VNDPIILHGARVYPRVSRRHGVKHTASIRSIRERTRASSDERGCARCLRSLAAAERRDG
jgi:hypothetical protein